MKRIVRAIEALAWFAFFAFAAAVLVLRYGVLPEIGGYREQIAAAVSRAAGLPVKIGAIEADWAGLRPRMRLRDVRIADRQGREALVLPSVDAILAWESVLRLAPRLHRVAIESPHLTVRRDAAGEVYVAGIHVERKGGAGAPDLGLLSALGEVLVRGAEVEWVDEQRGAPPLVLSSLELRLASGLRTMAVGLTARPPAALGTSVDLRARMQTRGPDWSGRAFVEVGYLDFAAWRPWIDYPVDVRQGQGALRAWATVENGAVTAATADVALADVWASLGDELTPLELAAVRGRVQGRDLRDGVEAAGRGLAVLFERGGQIPPTDFQLVWRPQAGGLIAASSIDLEATARLVGSLPVPPQVGSRLKALAPHGRVADLHVEWSGPFDAPKKLSARGRFSDLALRPEGTRPGFSGLSGTLEATEAGGKLALASKNVRLELPELYAQALELDALSGDLGWRADHSLTFSLEATNRDLRGSIAGSSKPSGDLDLSAHLPRFDGASLDRYLPRAVVMGEGVRGWLARGVIGGEVSDLRARLRGNLRDFPFADPTRGEFRVTARVKDGVLDYAEGWPRIDDIACELVFERGRFELAASGATSLGVRLANVRVSIPGFARPRVLISGQADGPSAEFLKFIASSPVRGMAHGATDGMTASGDGRLRLKLELPLDDLDATKVAGEYEFARNSLTLQARLAPIEQASGALVFSDESFSLKAVRGRLLGGPVEIAGGTRPGKGLEVAVRGEASVEALRARYDPPLGQQFSGRLAYTANVDARDGLLHVVLESPLVGVESVLPPPLAKKAGDALPLRIELAPAAGGQRDRITLTLGALVRAEIARRKQGGAMEVQRSAVWLSPEADEAIRLPERPGTLVYGSLGALDLDDWLPLFASGGGDFDQAVALDVKLGTLDGFGRRLTKVALRASAEPKGWSANVNAAELAGDVSYHSEGGGKLIARLERFSIPADTPGAVQQPAAKPGDLPALDLVAEEFIYRGKPLGKVELVAGREGDDLRIERASMVTDDASLAGTGMWRAAPAHTSFDFVLDASDVGSFLERSGFPGMVKGGRAHLQGAIAWNGDPGAIDFPSLKGELEMQAESGQFLEVDPGLGKLVGLMSLQALPRRVTLDFRDVFSKGFAFDRITAGAEVDHGVLRLREFHMRGAAADVEMSGETDLARETQNLKVRITPGLGLGDSAAIGIGLFNPIAGVAAALAQRVLKNPLGQLLSFEYSVTGTWEDPKVAKIQAKAPERLVTPVEAGQGQ